MQPDAPPRSEIEAHRRLIGAQVRLIGGQGWLVCLEARELAREVWRLVGDLRALVRACRLAVGRTWEL